MLIWLLFHHVLGYSLIHVINYELDYMVINSSIGFVVVFQLYLIDNSVIWNLPLKTLF